MCVRCYVHECNYKWTLYTKTWERALLPVCGLDSWIEHKCLLKHFLHVSTSHRECTKSHSCWTFTMEPIKELNTAQLSVLHVLLNLGHTSTNCNGCMCMYNVHVCNTAGRFRRLWGHSSLTQSAYTVDFATTINGTQATQSKPVEIVKFRLFFSKAALGCCRFRMNYTSSVYPGQTAVYHDCHNNSCLP